MKWFRRNVFRQARQNKGAFLGSVLIIAIGIFIYVSMTDAMVNLDSQIKGYYETSRLGDVFASVSGISKTELKRLEEIPGIETATGRMSEDIRILADGQKEIVTVHLLSYDQDDLLDHITLSTPFSGKDQIFLGNRMENKYNYEYGSTLKLLWNGKATKFTLAGVCYSPAYVYAIPSQGAMVPDGEIYDVACITKERMEQITGKHDCLNELSFSLSPGYTYEEVRHQLSDQLNSYGLISLVPRKDQESFNLVNGEMKELTSMGTILPVMFLSISLFMLYVALKKMIDRDQSLIGTMKAFGLNNWELMQAYLLEGAVTGAVGACLGALMGIPFGKFLFDVYVDFYNLPEVVFIPHISVRLWGLLIAVSTGVLAVSLGIRDILSIAPAQAMRAPAPVIKKNITLPAFLMKRLGPMERMGFRSIARNPFRGFLIILAVAFPFSMSSVLFSFQSVADQMYMDQFNKIQTYDFQLTLEDFTNPVRAVQAAEVLDGVKQAEAVYSREAELKNGNRTELVVITGLNRNSDMWRIMDMYGKFYEPPQRGVIINSRKAEKLHVKVGDILEVSCPGMTVDTVKVPVEGIISEFFGSGCYMSMEGISNMFQTGPASNNVLIKAQEGMRDTVKQKIMKAGAVTWLVDTERAIKSYEELMRSMMVTIHMFLFMSIISGGILIYNISMINIRERVREFGTLRVLGGSSREIGQMLVFEQILYFIAGILIGIPGSWGVKTLVESILKSDSYAVVMTVSPGGYGLAFFICLAISFAALAAEVRFVLNIQLTEVLKERE